MKVQSLAAHPLLVAVALGLLSPTSLAGLTLDRAPKEVRDANPNPADDGLDSAVVDLLDELRADV